MNEVSREFPGEEMAVSERAGAWSRYWATGARHSCAGSFVGHYGEATADFWRKQFAKLTPSDHLLELGCGNGSLLRFLAEMHSALPAGISAVDSAKLDPSWVATLPTAMNERLSLYAGTPAQALPLPDHSVTHLCSQYALEYFAADDVWAEIQRVLAPEAAVSVISHHADSLLSQVAKAECQHCEWLLSPDGVLDNAEALLPVFFDLAALGPQRVGQDPVANRKRAEFNQVLMALEERAHSHQHGQVLHDVAQQVMRILKMGSVAGNQDRANVAMQQLRTVVQDSRLRALELVACALDESAVTGWCQRLRAIGMQHVDVAPIHEQSHLFGWTIVATVSNYTQ